MFSNFSIAVFLSYIKLDERQTGLSNFRSMKFIGLSLVLVECVTCSSTFSDWIILNTTNVFPHRFNRDTDPQLRRTAHKVLGVYRKTGRWNIL